MWSKGDRVLLTAGGATGPAVVGWVRQCEDALVLVLDVEDVSVPILVVDDGLGFRSLITGRPCGITRRMAS